MMDSNGLVRRFRNCSILLLVCVAVQNLQYYNKIAGYFPLWIAWSSLCVVCYLLRKHSRVAMTTLWFSLALLALSLATSFLPQSPDNGEGLEMAATDAVRSVILLAIQIGYAVVKLVTLFWIGKLASELAEPVNSIDEAGLQTKVEKSFRYWLIAAIALSTFRFVLLGLAAAMPFETVGWLIRIPPRVMMLPKLAVSLVAFFAAMNCYLLASAWYQSSGQLVTKPIKFKISG